MDRIKQAIDEYTLAAFIAGTLSDQRRTEVIAYLADNADARELLHMAYQALQAAETTDEGAGLPVHQPGEPARSPAREPDRGAGRRPAHRLQGASRYVVAMAVVFAVGLGLRLAFGPPTDALRSQIPVQADELLVQVSTTDLTMAWNAIPDTYLYRVVVWDPQAARVVARYETAENETERGDPFTAELLAQLTAGHTYTVRIDAIDAQNRLVLSSSVVEFTPRS